MEVEFCIEEYIFKTYSNSNSERFLQYKYQTKTFNMRAVQT